MANVETHSTQSRSRYYVKRPEPYDERNALAVKSKVTNGRHVFAVGGDGRGKWTRRWKDICARHVSCLGGADLLSEAQISMVRRSAAMQVQLEGMEARMSKGDDAVDLGIYGRLASEMRRMFETIGTVRVARDISGEVEEYFEPRRPTTDRRRKDHRP